MPQRQPPEETTIPSRPGSRTPVRIPIGRQASGPRNDERPEVGELRDAIRLGQLEVHYQPIVDLVNGNLCSVEALVRWRHPDRGLVAPFEFIGLAETSGLIRELTEFVTAQVVAQTSTWAAAGRPLSCAVNLSVHCLTDTRCANDLIAILGTGQGHVTVEVTESVLADDRAVSVLRQLSDLGVYAAIDDFGTGYSCLAALKDLPVKVVKIDRSFVKDLDKDPRNLAIITMILQLAWTLRLGVIAEGIETTESADLLRQSGVRLGQGYLYARPMALADLEEWIASNRIAAAIAPTEDRSPEGSARLVAGSTGALQESHRLLFYADDRVLVDKITARLRHVLSTSGDTVFIVGTQRLAALRAALPPDLLDSAEYTGRIAYLGIDETLEQVMRNGVPDPTLFDDVVGSALRTLVARGNTCSVYNEMTAKLWSDGANAAALTVEQLFNKLQEATPFHLRCAYHAADATPDHSLFHDLWGLHSSVQMVPIEPGASQTGQTFSAAVDLDVPLAGWGLASVSEADAMAASAAIVQSSHDAIIGKDLLGRITSWNPGAERLYGYRPDEVMGRSLSTLVDQGSRPLEAAMLTTIFKGERSEVLHTRRVHKNGSLLHVALALSPIVDTNGVVIGVASSSRDVSEVVVAESLFESLLESAPDGMVCIDVNGVITFVNAQLELLCGRSRHDLINQPFDILVEAGPAAWHALVRAAYESGPDSGPVRPTTRQMEVRRSDGTTFPADVSMSRVGVGSQAMVTAAIRDISDRIAAQKALQESESRLRQVAENVDINFTLKDLANSTPLYSSPPMASIYGENLARGGIVGSWMALVHPDDCKRVQAVFDATNRSSRNVGAEFRIVRPDGAVRWVRGTSTLILAADGVTPRVVETVQDINDRKTLELELTRRIQMIDRMEEAARVGAWSLEVPSMEMTWSDGVYRIYDLDPTTPVSVAIGLGGYPASARTTIQSGIDNGKGWEVESSFTSALGRSIWVHTIGTPVWEGGVLVRFVGAFQDTTIIRTARSELETLNGQLEDRVAERTGELEQSLTALAKSNTALLDANQELESFSYSISHDLRAPLRAILGFSQILAGRHRGSLDEQGRHFVDNIVNAGERMSVMIDDLLAYCRLSQGVVPLGPVDLEPVFRQLTATFQERAESLGAVLSVGSAVATPLGDRTLIEQILNNLVDNALTYRREEGTPRVEVAVLASGDEVVLTVADNGIGIPSEYFKRVFEAFQRLHSDERYPGTGIGLASVRKAAQRMNGEVTLASTPGVGSTFSVRLPRARARSAALLPSGLPGSVG